MASNQTQHLQLCQWEAEDEVLRADFNADNAKIDAAVAAAEGKITALQTALAQLAAKAGNCIVVVGTYTGTGTYGEGHSTRLSFPHRPAVVLLDDMYTLINGQPEAEYQSSGSRYSVRVTWGEKSVSWYGTDSADKQCNSIGPHRYVAFLDKEN